MWIRGRGRSISLEAESIGHAANNNTAKVSGEEQPNQRESLHFSEDDIIRQMATHFIVNENKKFKEKDGSCNHGSAEKIIMSTLEMVS